MNARHRRRDFLRPLVECLEPRRLLACEVYVRDQTLFVLGDEADDRIEIVADDRTVQVACDGGEPQTFSASEVIRLFVDTGDADDTLDILVQPGGQLTQFEIHAGAGVDNVHVRLPADNAGIAIHAAIGAAGLSDIQLDHPQPEGPITAARFELSIDGHEFAVFQELEGLDTEVESVEYLSSEEKETILIKLSDDENILGIKLSGRWSTPSSITLEPGMRRDQVVIVDEAGHSAPMSVDMDLGDGDDIVSVLRNQPLDPAGPAKSGYQFNLGLGNDRFQWSAGGANGAGESYTFSRGEPDHSIDIDVDALDTTTPPTSIHLEGAEATIVKAGDGDDEFHVNGWLATALNLFGQGGDDILRIITTVPPNFDPGETDKGAILDYDGGDGRDDFKLGTSDLAERIEIQGVPDQEVLDPLIRVTDLATNLLTAESSIVGTETITVDARGGDDQIVMREMTARLSNVNWTIVTGIGNDIVDVQMDLLPDVLHVDTGSGNDHVDVQFAANANFPPGQRRETPAEIAIDVGSGVDSVVLDVFGSLLSPPGEIALQTTLAEVLAAIQVQGVGLLALLTLFPLGALEMAQAIRDDRQGHTKTEATIDLDGANLAVHLATAATSDSVLIDLAPLPGSQVGLNLNTGRADDHIEVRSKSPAGPLDWTLDVVPGSGIDEVVVAFEHGDPDQPIIIGALWQDEGGSGQGGSVSITNTADSTDIQFGFDLVGTAGRDVVDLEVFCPSAPDRFVSEIDVATGQGNDAIDVGVESAAAQVLQELRVDAGEGIDVVGVEVSIPGSPCVLAMTDIDTGGGADQVRVIWRKLQLQTEFPSEVTANFNIDTGKGNDRAEVELQPGLAADNIFSCKLQLADGSDVARYWVYGTELPPNLESDPRGLSLGQFDLQVLGGQGSDDIQGRVGTSRSGQLLPLVLGHARIAVDGGDGRDRLSLDYRGAILDPAAVDLIVRGGAGEDQVRARLDLDPVSTGQLSVQVLGDDGNDELGLAVLGADDLALLLALLDGGRGKDRYRTTPNVQVVNCP